MKNKINKSYMLIAVYAILIITELLFCVPYDRIEVFRSEQNVPHTEIIGNGYAPIFEIQDSDALVVGKDRTSTGKRTNTSQLLINVSFTTFLMTVIYFLFIFKKKNFIAVSTEVPEILKKQNKQLQKTIDELSSKNAELLRIKNIYEKIFSKKDFSDRFRKSPTLPELDVNSLTFADDDTIRIAQHKYAEEMLNYIEYEIYKLFIDAYSEAKTE